MKKEIKIPTPPPTKGARNPFLAMDKQKVESSKVAKASPFLKFFVL